MPQRYDSEDHAPLDVTPPANDDAGTLEDRDIYAEGGSYGPSTVIAALDQIQILVVNSDKFIRRNWIFINRKQHLI